MSKTPTLYVERFTPCQRIIHLMIIVSFLTLAVTGMTLKFAMEGWAQQVADLAGGFAILGALHRFFAAITFLYFILTLGMLFRFWKNSGKTMGGFIFDPEGLVPNLNDVKEMVATLKWFFGGPRPQYGRWTYWEKFDYFAVFWGIFVIGLSGLLLWFSEFFTSVFGLPGWLLNVATIIHSDEALLATGFIFTVHFFNTHFRPDRFPMDPVIFTGRVSVAELQHERPRQFEAMGGDEGVRSRLVSPPSLFLTRLSTIFGLSALVVGLTTVLMVLYAMLYLYR